MRALIQRVREAAVKVDGRNVGAINAGFVVLLGVTHDDTEEDAAFLVRKIVGLRVFEDAEGKMNNALADVDGAVLAISQFTLYASVRKGRRPSFTQAALPEPAQRLYERFCEMMAETGTHVAKGVFQEHMTVSLVNDGPVTLWLDTNELMSKKCKLAVCKPYVKLRL